MLPVVVMLPVVAHSDSTAKVWSEVCVIGIIASLRLFGGGELAGVFDFKCQISSISLPEHHHHVAFFEGKENTR